MSRDLSVPVPQGVSAQIAQEPDAAWLDTVHRDLARDTAESAFLELFDGRSPPVDIASAALDMVVDHAVAIMRDVYAAIHLTDQGAIGRGRAIMAEAFADRFDELVAQAGAVRQGGC